MKEDHIRNIFLDIILTLLTCSLFNIYIQYKQIIAINEMLKEERYSFLKWLLFTIFTFGLYHIYHEYVKGEDVGKCVGADQSIGLISLILTVFGLHIISDAIQQYHINQYYGENRP